MPTSATDQYFTKVFHYNGSSYTDITLEMQSPAGTSSTILSDTNDVLYLGDTSRFDLAIFDVDTAGSLGALTWEYSSGTPAWTAFTPLSATYHVDPDDSPDTMFDFSKDGAETFPVGRMSDWATETVSSSDIHWVRCTSAASVSTAPSIKSIRKRPLASYCSTQDVFNLLQLKNVSTTDGSGTDFTTSTIPTKVTVEQYIEAAQSYIDFTTRKSWRPNFIHEEYHQFKWFSFR